ncbi:MAG TPA: PDZ domain-containing protein [Saprospiraceae bacterium]|nr:PDZ domain-containing protein [Saprospiraceae bacterium]
MIIRTIMTFAVVFTLVVSATAQDTNTKKKVVIVKKTDDNGKITESRTEAEGAEADALIKKMEAEEGVSINESDEKGKKVIRIDKSTTEKEINSSDNKNVEITTEIINGNKKEKYKIIKSDEEGDQTMEWDGEGEMPEDIRKELEQLDIDTEIEGDVMRIHIDANGMEKEENDERIVINKKLRDGDKRQRMMWKERDGKPSFPEGRNRSLSFKSDSPNTNKVSLGVMIENTDSGVVVTDIVPGSAAESAGLRRGDTILKINDKYIFTINGLLEALNPFNPDEKVKIKYIREGKEKSGSGKLKAR